jgi:hypothetical protein
MRKGLVSVVAMMAMVGSLVAAFPAEAGHRDWVLGSLFRIGSMSFQLVFRDFDRGRPIYFYRTGGHFRESRYRCNDRCFREDDHYFHDAYCPRLLSHFDDQGYNPYSVFERYSPRPNRHSDREYYDDRDRRGGRSEWRDDRWDDSWRWRHYQRRHHRHDNSCRHRH